MFGCSDGFTKACSKLVLTLAVDPIVNALLSAKSKNARVTLVASFTVIALLDKELAVKFRFQSSI